MAEAGRQTLGLVWRILTEHKDTELEYWFRIMFMEAVEFLSAVVNSAMIKGFNRNTDIVLGLNCGAIAMDFFVGFPLLYFKILRMASDGERPGLWHQAVYFFLDVTADTAFFMASLYQMQGEGSTTFTYIQLFWSTMTLSVLFYTAGRKMVATITDRRFFVGTQEAILYGAIMTFVCMAVVDFGQAFRRNKFKPVGVPLSLFVIAMLAGFFILVKLEAKLYRMFCGCLPPLKDESDKGQHGNQGRSETQTILEDTV